MEEVESNIDRVTKAKEERAQELKARATRFCPADGCLSPSPPLVWNATLSFVMDANIMALFSLFTILYDGCQHHGAVLFIHHRLLPFFSPVSLLPLQTSHTAMLARLEDTMKDKLLVLLAQKV